jgi:hypothetical protein
MPKFSILLLLNNCTTLLCILVNSVYCLFLDDSDLCSNLIDFEIRFVHRNFKDDMQRTNFSFHILLCSLDKLNGISTQYICTYQNILLPDKQMHEYSGCSNDCKFFRAWFLQEKLYHFRCHVFFCLIQKIVLSESSVDNHNVTFSHLCTQKYI